jgi:hypothetical protein
MCNSITFVQGEGTTVHHRLTIKFNYLGSIFRIQPTGQRSAVKYIYQPWFSGNNTTFRSGVYSKTISSMSTIIGAMVYCNVHPCTIWSVASVEAFDQYILLSKTVLVPMV